ncbi:hypothetical protein C1T31_03835 [Hanstruepera neustonica]|uniref:Uncharacterized protein n=1 Tax=Hanstruepera neustonica TaxID=1445657 RepID=A0A2K1E4R7_9FLAO|nr:hypothetical protein [Hanstruepera neustonica]PNQ75272.1 hypothetical protein C1T31_03835 [Hanstruepera neustonica]
MSFGVVQSAITAIKNNKGLLSQRDKLKNTLSSVNNKKVEFKKTKASPQVLREIRERLRQEQQDRKRKIITIFSVIMSVVLSLFFYFF